MPRGCCRPRLNASSRPSRLQSIRLRSIRPISIPLRSSLPRLSCRFSRYRSCSFRSDRLSYKIRKVRRSSARAPRYWSGRAGASSRSVPKGSLAAPQFERKAGSAQVSRRALFFQLGARLRLHQAWELNARGGLSYVHYAASGVAQPGYLGQELDTGTGAASLSLGAAYYFVRAFGVYLDLSGLVAFDAARVRLATRTR